ncbi:hypothetical protein EIP91_004530 [Steccherinum ochraceum]|uniref:Uncharacterized protein n=1 Tax=Steccherinum ochraceum TaxID=92696 RepID=A0A4V2MVX1_9APHY|nr:hypothetical protein EIP91_004530 [Steccherinum ochraceum]
MNPIPLADPSFCITFEDYKSLEILAQEDEAIDLWVNSKTTIYNDANRANILRALNDVQLNNPSKSELLANTVSKHMQPIPLKPDNKEKTEKLGMCICEELYLEKRKYNSSFVAYFFTKSDEPIEVARFLIRTILKAISAETTRRVTVTNIVYHATTSTTAGAVFFDEGFRDYYEQLVKMAEINPASALCSTYMLPVSTERDPFVPFKANTDAEVQEKCFRMGRYNIGDGAAKTF